MKGFVRGILVGVGIGLLVAPLKGEEMRRLLAERVAGLRGYLPQNEQLNQYVQQVSERVSQTGSNLRGYAQEAASKMKETGSALGDLAQKATFDVRQTSQDVADVTRQTIQSARQSAQVGSTDNKTSS